MSDIKATLFLIDQAWDIAPVQSRTDSLQGTHMMLEKRQLPGTDFTIGRIGISSSFGADVDVYEEAFERG